MNIRRKLFFQIGAIMILFIALLYLANSFLLETFYVNSAKSKLIGIFDTVNAMEKSTIDSNSLYALLLSSRTFVEIAVIDETSGLVIIPTNPQFANPNQDSIRQAGKLPPLDKVILQHEEVINETDRFVWFNDPRNNFDFFMFTGDLDNGLRIDIRIPMASIQENVGFFNQFILIAGVFLLLVTSLAASLFAKHFTKPILNMFKVTDSIKNMDFSTTCEVLTKDELGKLAENINQMSNSLKSNLSELEDRNRLLSVEVQERAKIDEQRKALLNNVSHELKTPLSLVQGYSEGLKLNLNNDIEKTTFYCDVIIDEAKKMDALVSQLLEINHIQFGDFPLHKEVIEAKEFIDYIIKKYEPILSESRIAFQYEFNHGSLEAPLMIEVDALRSEQIITNLINNAIAYVDENKEICVSVTQSVTMSETASEIRHLKFEVANSFEPINPDELQNWWNSFYKADKARTRENGGYGLGLSIIKAIQEADSNLYGVYYEKGMIRFFVEFDILAERNIVM